MTSAVSSARRAAVADCGRRFQSKNPDGDTSSQQHIFFTGYAYFTESILQDSMNSYFSVTGDPGRSTLRLFQELVFHFEFSNQALGFAEPGSLVEVERRLVAGVLEPIGCHPVPESSFIDAQLTGNLSDRTRVRDDGLHGLVLELGGELPSFLWHVPSLSR